jgi:hypothetical protein
VRTTTTEPIAWIVGTGVMIVALLLTPSLPPATSAAAALCNPTFRGEPSWSKRQHLCDAAGITSQHCNDLEIEERFCMHGGAK